MRSKLEDLKELRDLVGTLSSSVTIAGRSLRRRPFPEPVNAVTFKETLSRMVLMCKIMCSGKNNWEALSLQVRSLGRGGGWGPLRRAPIQNLDMKGRPGLLRTVLEQQETRGLTRADDLSRLLPSEVPRYCLESDVFV